jgi:cytochrome oxidase assembly protein ShyY1
MVALGIWQLARLQQKQAALAAYRANMHLPPTAYPLGAPTDERYLFRTVSAQCMRVLGWQVTGGHTRDGMSGWRHIAHCATGRAGVAPLLVDMGVSGFPDVVVKWHGGSVVGRAAHAPDATSLIMRMAGRAPPPRLMIVSEAAAPGLSPSALPDPSSVPNNHLAYAAQWFFFATVALLIYGLALRKRWREEPEADENENILPSNDPSPGQ